jgi:hypothetical protein
MNDEILAHDIQQIPQYLTVSLLDLINVDNKKTIAGPNSRREHTIRTIDRTLGRARLMSTHQQQRR